MSIEKKPGGRAEQAPTGPGPTGHEAPPVVVPPSPDTEGAKAAARERLKPKESESKKSAAEKGKETQGEEHKGGHHEKHPAGPGFFTRKSKELREAVKAGEVKKAAKAASSLVLRGGVTIEGVAAALGAGGLLAGAVGYPAGYAFAAFIGGHIIVPGAVTLGSFYLITWILGLVQKAATGSGPKTSAGGGGGGGHGH